MQSLSASSRSSRFAKWSTTPLPVAHTAATLLLLSAASVAAWLPPQTRHALLAPLVHSSPAHKPVPRPVLSLSAPAPLVRLAAYRPGRVVRPRAVMTLKVTSTGDGDAANTSACQTSSANGATCTLRAAIEVANANGGATISFALPGSGVQTIAPATALPTITAPVTINGTSQPGASANTLAAGDNAKILVAINGANAGGAIAALNLGAGSGGSSLRGLAIGGSAGAGVLINGSNGDTVAGCFIGTDASGQAGPGNKGAGVSISASNNTLIGGASPAARNVISGNGANVNHALTTGINHFSNVYLSGGGASNTVTGNFIGTDATGTKALGNGGAGVQIFSFNPDKTATTGTVISNNLLSGNATFGADIAGSQTTGTLVQGNFIGTDVSGTVAVGNGLTAPQFSVGTGGVNLSGTLNSGNSNTIGGTGAGQGNLIAGNVGVGVNISAGSNNFVQNNLIGTDVTGLKTLGSLILGVAVNFSNNSVQGNTIASATRAGITLFGQTTTATKVQGNRIGVGVDGKTPTPNPGYGILIVDNAASNVIGDPMPTAGTGSGGPTNSGLGNIIADNGLAGVALQPQFVGGSPQQDSILGNVITGNGEVGIDLGNFGAPLRNGSSGFTPNEGQSYPVLSGAAIAGSNITLTGTLVSAPNATYRIELFSNPQADPTGFGQGQTFLGFQYVTTDGKGNASFSTALPYSGTNGVFSATATDKYGDTGEFGPDFPPAASAGACSTVVTTTANNGMGSLRSAILCADASTSATPVPISFNIPGAGVQTISPLSPLPAITRSVVLDGFTQPGSSANTLAIGSDAKPLIELSGANIGSTVDVNGLTLFAGSDGSTVRGLVINRWSGNGLLAEGPFSSAFKQGFVYTGYSGLTNVSIAGCFFGTDPTGTLARANGVGATVTPGGSTFTVGSPAPADRNLFSGNVNDGLDVAYPFDEPGLAIPKLDCVVSGNYLGTNAAGTGAVPNGGLGISNFFHTTGNLLSGNTRAGASTGGILDSNLIGTNAAGTGAVPNGIGMVGGVGTITNNVIAGNTGDGIQLNNARGVTMSGNFIGVTRGGSALGNGANGIEVMNYSFLLFIGSSGSTAGNTIADNAGSGIVLADETFLCFVNGNSIYGNAGTGLLVTATGGTTGTRISQNSIHDNGKLGIDLGGDGVTLNQTTQPTKGANFGQNFPVISGISGGVASATLSSAPKISYTVEFFASPSPDASGYGQGQTYLGSQTVTTDASGNTGTFTFTLPAGTLGYLTATATDAGNPSGATDAAPLSTSEFSKAVLIPGTTVTPTAVPTATATTAPTATAVPPPTATAAPTATAVPPPTATAAPTATAVPPPTATAAPTPTAAPTATATVTPTAAPTATGVPVATATPKPSPTATPTATATPVATATPKPAPTATSVPVPTATPVPSKAVTQTAIASSLNPSKFGQSVTLTAKVSVATTSAGKKPGKKPRQLQAAPTGSVTFFDAGNTLGTGTLSGGVATFSTSTLSVMTHALTALYAGDANFNGSTSNTLSQVVTGDPVLSVSQTASAPTVGLGGSATFSIVVKNTGTATAPAVVVFDTLPASATFVSATGGTVVQSGQNLTFTVGALGVGASQTLSVTVTAPATVGTLINSVTASATGATGTPTAPVPAQVQVTNGAPAFTFGIGKLIYIGPYTPSLYRPGGHFIQTVTITNTGTASATGPLQLVLDSLPSMVTLVGATGASASGAPFITVPLASGTLGIGGSSSIRLEFRLKGGAKPTFTPRIASATGG